MKKDEIVGIKEMRCPICGKVFAMVCTERWVYKRRFDERATVYYCSYGCTVKADREREEQSSGQSGEKAKKRQKTVEKGMYIEAMRENGMTYSEIAKKLGVSLKYAHQLHEEYQNIRAKREV